MLMCVCVFVFKSVCAYLGMCVSVSVGVCGVCVCV